MTEATLSKPKPTRGIIVSLAGNHSIQAEKHIAQQIQQESEQLIELISSAEAADIYKQAGTRTFAILVKIARILLFSLLLLGALILWIWGIGFQIGYYLRALVIKASPKSIFDVAIGVASFISRLVVSVYQQSAKFVEQTLGWTFKLPTIEEPEAPAQAPEEDASSDLVEPAAGTSEAGAKPPTPMDDK